MLKLISTIIKEYLILIRDRSGLAILFLMPVALVTLMALIQDAPFRDYQELEIPAILVNKDNGELGSKIETGLIESKLFTLTVSDSGEANAIKQVADGEYDICIIIPENTSDHLDGKVKFFVNKTLHSMGMMDTLDTDTIESNTASSVAVYFKPGIKKSFKNSLMSSIRQVATKLESTSLISTFKKELTPLDTIKKEEEAFGDFISFTEQSPVSKEISNLELNSVQHNVPAWTMFGMFFIVISLAGSIIKEREDGSYLRILTMPGSYLVVLGGKIITYLLVCMIQCVLMLMVGIYLMPILGLPKLVIGDSFGLIFIVALCSGLAATGFGVLVGTLFNTHQQSSTFGAVSVVILAALGGIWVPVYVMPDILRILAELSPLYWGLNSFQNLFLGDGSLQAVGGYIFKLLLFFAFTLTISVLLNKFRNN